jgi:hypothetical protein
MDLRSIAVKQIITAWFGVERPNGASAAITVA